MAGVPVLEIDSTGRGSNVPDDFQTITFGLTEATLDNVDSPIIYYAERDTVIDSAVFIAGDTDVAAVSFILKSCSSGQDVESAGTAFTTSITAFTANVPVLATIDTDNNIIPAGSFVACDIGDTASTINSMLIQMRIRTRIG
tara:strand:- start:316 stop:741 length:426 start_codon:yes stop_codon:yes gene_type:complete